MIDQVRAWLSADDPDPWVVTTSGSTGAPKTVHLSRAAVLASATAALDRLGGPGGWLLALPPSGVGGLQVLVRSVLAGIEPVVSSDVSAAGVGGDRRYVSLVPTQLHRLDAADQLGGLADFDAVLLGGAAAEPDLLHRARTAGVRVVRTYGMTETCGGCVYDGTPLAGVSMRIVDEEVELRGPVLADGLDLRDGWFRTGDLGEIGSDGRLRVTGRRDDVVQSGGVKIPLPAVTAAVKRLDAVRDAIVLGRPDPEWGASVTAFVVPTDAVCLDALRVDEVRDAVEALGLPRTWAPREVVLVDALPLLPNGKVDRRRLLG